MGDQVAALMRCQACDAPVRLTEPGVMRRVSGWVKERKGGGANAVYDMVEHHEYMCPSCWKEKELGGQSVLL